MDPMFTGEENRLKDLLYRDAQQSRYYARDYKLTQVDPNDIEHSVSTLYGELQAQLVRQAGYPKLYRQAWETLRQAVQNQDWVTLGAIDRVFDKTLPTHQRGQVDDVLREHAHEISVWHIKTVLYVWSRVYKIHNHPIERLPDNLLASIESVNAFINMTPQEATVRLAQSHLNNMNALPYLFRISSTEPGAISLSFLAPVSNQVLHRRFISMDSLQPFLSPDIDLYRLLFQFALPGYLDQQATTVIDMDTLTLLMRQLDPKLSEQTIRNKLRRVANTPLVGVERAYETLRIHFFPNTRLRLLTPQTLEERIGVTESYTASYVSMSSAAHLYRAVPFGFDYHTRGGGGLGGNESSSEVPCFSCHVTQAIHKETDNNRLYCSNECYEDDLVLCY